MTAPAALTRAGFPARRRSAALRPRKEPLALACLAVLLLASALVSLGAGAVGIPLGRILATLVGAPSADPGDALVLLQIRLPRLLLGGLVGAALAVSGALMQGLFQGIQHMVVVHGPVAAIAGLGRPLNCRPKAIRPFHG